MPSDATYDAVLASYHRCEGSGGFFDTFYDIFFAKSSDIPPKFANTNMEKQRQILGASLVWMLRFGRDDPIAKHEVEKLGETHSRDGHDIQPELYASWLDALCESVQQHDPEYTSELEAQWREIMQPGIDLIVSRY